MQKVLLATLFATALLTINSFANAADKTPSTVAAAKNMPEETIVVLEGTIAPGEDEEMYVFTDNTGSIDVVIDEEDTEGLNIGANDIVIIEGEIDQNGDNIEVDVEEITLAQ